MSFSNIYDAQVFVVQGVIQRKNLESSLVEAQTTDIKNTLKNQIRELQWNIDQANKYLLTNAIPALRYSNEIFSVDNLIKTPWVNEKDIPNTLQYDASLNNKTLEQIQNENISQIEQINTLLLETYSLLKQNKDKLDNARLLSDASTEKQNIIKESKQAISSLSDTIRILQEQKNLIEPQLNLPSRETNILDLFSQGIRNSLKASLLAKPGYVEQPGDVDAALHMRKIALDAYYTAKNDEERTAAIERLNRVYASLSPDVPIVRREMENSELFISAIIDQIATYNEIIYPKTIRLDLAQKNYEIARDSGIQEQIDLTKQEYDSANSDYNETLLEIRKLYDRILGFHSALGQVAMYPGSLTTATYTPPAPADGSDANGNSTKYQLIWDSKEEKFVSQKDATASPGRYITTEYTNSPISEQDTDAERVKKVLSQKYLEASKAEANYTYKKETELLEFQNKNRYDRIWESNKDLEKLDSDWASKKASGQVSDEDYLDYQAKKNQINQRISDDQKIINDNKKVIEEAAAKRDVGLNPFKSLETVQKEAQTHTDGTNRRVPEALPANSAQELSKQYYDSKSERQLAQRQLNTSIAITETAKQAAINEALSRGLTPEQANDQSNWNATLKNKYDDARDKQLAQNQIVKETQEKEFVAAKNAKSFIEKVSDKEEAQRILEVNGLRVGDIEKSLRTEGGSQTITDAQRIKIRDELLSQNLTKQNNIENRLTDIEDERSSINERINSQPPISDVEKIGLNERLSKLDSEKQELNSQLDNLIQETANIDDIIDQKIQEDAANERDLQADLSNTGFEGLNNSAPFYMQFPTLNSITDFKLRNGVDPYGEKSTDEIARDAVVFKIFETVPGVAESQEVLLPNGAKYIKNIPQRTNINTLGSFTIYPSHQEGGGWLNQQHNHTWVGGEQDTVARLFQGFLDVATTSESILKLTSAGLNAVQSGNLKGNELAGNVYNRQIDVLDYYQKSESNPITVTFNLFTRNNFLNDVFRPIMFLTALGYPKRALSGDLGKMIDLNIEKIEDLSRKFPDNAFVKFTSDLLSKGKGIGETVENLEKKFAEFGGIGPYRYFISKRPEYLTIRHASGLFYYPIAYIQNFSYTFKGPWYNFSGEPLESTRDLDSLISSKINESAPAPDKTFREKVNETFTNVSRGIRETFRPPPEPVPRPTALESRKSGTKGGLLEMSDNDIKFIRSKGLPFAYPSWAECTLTFKNASPFFRDDFMAMFYESQKGGEELVTLTQELTNQSKFAFGTRTAKGSLIDDAYNQKK